MTGQTTAISGLAGLLRGELILMGVVMAYLELNLEARIAAVLGLLVLVCCRRNSWGRAHGDVLRRL